MVDRCLFFEDVLRLDGRGQRSYELRTVAGGGLTCVDARVRQGATWSFARKWIRTGAGARELYRTLDRLEALGFRFHVLTENGAGLSDDERASLEEAERLDVRASVLRSGLDPEERSIHAELFPEEERLLSSGYDWDRKHVYRAGRPLATDPFGRVLDVEGDVLYEWVCVPEELTWRRYPLERLRNDVTVRGR